MIAIPYILIIFVFFLCHYLSNTNEMYKYSEKFFVYFVLVCFFCFRGYIFTDVFNYLPFFQVCPNIIDLYSSKFEGFAWWEPGFVSYCAFIKLFTNNWLIFQIIDSSIDLFLLYKGLNFFDSNRAENLIVFLSMSGMIAFIDNIRNIKAILIFFIALKYIYEKKIIKYYICCLIALSFHKSAIFYFFCYPLLLLNITKEKFLMFGIFSVVIGFISRIILLFVINICGGFIPDSFQVLIINYIYSTGELSIARAFTFGTFEKLLVFFLMCINYNKLYKESKTALLLKVFLCCFTSYFIFFGFGAVSNRVSMLFVFSYWCLISKLTNIQKKQYRFLYILCVFAYCLLKISLYHQPIQKYDNFLFKAASYEERYKIFKEFY